MSADPPGARPLLATRMAASQRSLAGVIDHLGRPGFATAALGELHAALGVGSWAVYRLRPDGPPTLHLSASQGPQDLTASCFSVYRDAALYRRDSSFAAVHRAAGAVMLRMHADEAPNTDHRDAIYRRHGVLERLSVARIETDGSLLAVNLYRHAHQQRFSGDDLGCFGELAPGLLASVAKHLAWPQASSAPHPRRAVLKQRCAQLTERELDVLERMLDGMTYDGIASDLGLSVATVKTYRLRAFERLGLHFKSELFASFLARH